MKAKSFKIGKWCVDLRPKEVERDIAGNWWMYHTIFGNISHCPERFQNDFAFELALAIAEIFFPIDAIADRVASVPFIKKNKSGETIELNENEHRLLSQPNVFTTGEQLIYSLVFSELADGNSYLYTKIPNGFSNITTDRITSLWCLRPDCTEIIQKSYTPNLFAITKKSDIIDYYQYEVTGDKLKPDHVLQSINMPLTMDDYCSLKGDSPMCAVEKNINNLIAVYNARYNVYANNGIAGIITKKAQNSNGALEAAVDPADREDIANELMHKHNIAGHNNIKAISAIPLDFLKTLATIEELEPFRETYEDAVQIAGIYGVPKELLPREKESTYSNQRDAERFFWQNRIKGVAEDVGRTLTKALAITDGELIPDFSGIEILQADRETELQADSIELNNIQKLRELGAVGTNELVNEMKKKYEKS